MPVILTPVGSPSVSSGVSVAPNVHSDSRQRQQEAISYCMFKKNKNCTNLADLNIDFISKNRTTTLKVQTEFWQCVAFYFEPESFINWFKIAFLTTYLVNCMKSTRSWNPAGDLWNKIKQWGLHTICLVMLASLQHHNSSFPVQWKFESCAMQGEAILWLALKVRFLLWSHWLVWCFFLLVMPGL